MGLQESNTSSRNSSLQETERVDLVWTLYTLDKQNCLVKDGPCLLYNFECSIYLPRNPQSLLEEYRLAQLRMACLMEDVYKHLYSPKAKRQEKEQREINMTHCKDLLESWWARHRTMLEDESETRGLKTIAKQQLSYVFYSTRILIHRCSDLIESHRVRLESARCALRLVRLLSIEGRLDTRYLLALRR
jgi:hypothetical protein